MPSLPGIEKHQILDDGWVKRINAAEVMLLYHNKQFHGVGLAHGRDSDVLQNQSAGRVNFSIVSVKRSMIGAIVCSANLIVDSVSLPVSANAV